MGSYPSGALVRDRLMASLNSARTQTIFEAFLSEVEDISLSSSGVHKNALTQSAAVQVTVDHILKMPAGLAHSNFVDADIRKTFRKAVVCASKIRGMILWSVVGDWKTFVSLLEDLYGHLSKLQTAVDDH